MNFIEALTELNDSQGCLAIFRPSFSLCFKRECCLYGFEIRSFQKPSGNYDSILWPIKLERDETKESPDWYRSKNFFNKEILEYLKNSLSTQDMLAQDWEVL